MKKILKYLKEDWPRLTLITGFVIAVALAVFSDGETWKMVWLTVFCLAIAASSIAFIRGRK